MKIVRFQSSDSDKIKAGVLEEKGKIRVVNTLYRPDEQTGETYSLSDVSLCAPVHPPDVIAIGLNYRQHAKESGAPLPEEPVVFLKATSSVTGPDSHILLPRVAPDQVDYEAELAIMIGEKTRNITEKDALQAVLGYTCGNDVSARDCQHKRDKQWARAKSFDTFCPLGPWIETDIDPDNLHIESRLNGNVMQSSTTSDQIFNCRRLISFLSQCITLYPGTVIMTGTPAGVGMGQEPPVYMKDGDTIEVTVSGIGTLRNSVAAEPAHCSAESADSK